MDTILILAILILLLCLALGWLAWMFLSIKSRLALFEKLEVDLQASQTALSEVRKFSGEKENAVARLEERLSEQEKSFQSERARVAEENANSKSELSLLSASMDIERQKVSEKSIEIASVRGERDASIAHSAKQEETIQEQKQRITDLDSQLEEKQKNLTRISIEIATMRSERDSAQDQLKRYQEGDKSRGELVRAEIENLSNKIFEEKAGKFKEIGTSAIADLVTPVRENLEKLQKALTESETKDAVREQSLREALERVGQTSIQLSQQAENLTKALRSDNKLVGDFGEEILERILEFSGLQKGPHFVEQGIDMSLKTEDGRHLKPDIVIKLPENRCLVVDSKMSLKSWVDAQTDDESARAMALDTFKNSVRSHVNGLASKPYTESLSASGMVVVDFKFLFIPIESAFHSALQLDRNLYQFAFEKKVILVSPTTLLAVLTTVNHTWKQFDIGKNAESIRGRAEILLSKLIAFETVFVKIGDSINAARESYDLALKRLTTGNGHLIRQTKILQELKVDSNKPIPPALLAVATDGEEE